MKLDKIIGHKSIINQINNSIDKGMFSHAHLIVGEDGIGKSLIARGIGLKILGKDLDREYTDLVEYRIPNNKKSIGIKDVVDKVIDEINKKPYEGDKKVIIIYEANKMTVEAQNAFLKTIEEPPKGVFIILLCEKLDEILETIKSRCQIHKLQRLSFEEMYEFLSYRYKTLTTNDIKTIIAFSDGIPGRALKFIEDKNFKDIRDNTLNILLDINSKNIEEFLKYEKFLIKYKDQWQEVLTWILSYIRDIMVYKETGKEDIIINLDKINIIKDMSSIFSFNRLSAIIDIVNESRQRLESNVNTSLTFSTMLIKFLDS